MDRLAGYRQIIRRILAEYDGIKDSSGDSVTEIVFDGANDRYLVLDQGWEGVKRVHSVVLHVEVINGKVWLQCNNTDVDIAQDMVLAGIPREHIVLGLHEPEVRQYTEYAAA